MSFSRSTTSRGYDLIGDVHGHADALTTLLAEMDYARNQYGGFTHSANRQAVFVGDLVNRGPKIRETLQIARKMVESGSALVILGNHELNVLGMETNGADGLPLRPHTRQNCIQSSRTKSAFRDYPGEWSENLAWIRTLPLSLELEGLRIVHAVWHPPSLEIIAGRNFEDGSFLRSAFTRKTPEEIATGITLKGIKVPLPLNKAYR
ncbi:MAG: metallophosphoesterase, partial [Opitutales bacterium]